MDAATVKAQDHYRKKLSESMKADEDFIGSKIAGLVEAKNSFETKKTKLTESYTKATKAHVRKIDEFVKKQMERELNEFAIDRNALIETRVNLIKGIQQTCRSSEAFHFRISQAR